MSMKPAGVMSHWYDCYLLGLRRRTYASPRFNSALRSASGAAGCRHLSASLGRLSAVSAFLSWPRTARRDFAQDIGNWL
jgi:hypothetical protein